MHMVQTIDSTVPYNISHRIILYVYVLEYINLSKAESGHIQYLSLECSSSLFRQSDACHGNQGKNIVSPGNNRSISNAFYIQENTTTGVVSNDLEFMATFQSTMLAPLSVDCQLTDRPLLRNCPLSVLG